MNTATLAASLVMAAALAVVAVLLIRAMLGGWLRRAQRQAWLIGALPSLPDTVGAPIIAPTPGLYVGSTLAPSWLDRIAVGDLGYCSKAVLSRHPEGIMMRRSGADPIWIPAGSITAIRTERGIAGKVVARDGILAIRWRLPSGTEIDTGFRGDDRGKYGDWLREA
ncbi:MAG: transporter [Mycobacteriaceae bacterium]|nr:transporter [Mycobacteriaceae bacterium]